MDGDHLNVQDLEDHMHGEEIARSIHSSRWGDDGAINTSEQ